MQTIKPAKKQLFCRPDKAEKTTSSGLLLIDSAEKPKTAQVINIGDEVSGYEANDKIIYKSYATTDFKLNNEDYFLVEEQDVLGTVLEVAE